MIETKELSKAEIKELVDYLNKYEDIGLTVFPSQTPQGLTEYRVIFTNKNNIKDRLYFLINEVSE